MQSFGEWLPRDPVYFKEKWKRERDTIGFRRPGRFMAQQNSPIRHGGPGSKNHEGRIPFSPYIRAPDFGIELPIGLLACVALHL
jgi:hypothetical protein